MQYLHAQHVVHHDIKPENILLDGDRTIRIVDFGLSTNCAPGQVLRHACGSPCYAAPEMLTREGQKQGYVGHPVDVWSSGVTLFAMICGCLPFEHANTSALYQKIIQGEYALPPFVSSSAKDVLKKLLTTDPARRWPLEQIAAHPWCTADGAAHAVVRPGSKTAGAVAQPAFETEPDLAILERAVGHGFDAATVVGDVQTGKQSAASATYWLLRLRALCNPAAAAVIQFSLSGARRGVVSAPRPQSALREWRACESNTSAHGRSHSVPTASAISRPQYSPRRCRSGTYPSCCMRAVSASLATTPRRCQTRRHHRCRSV